MRQQILNTPAILLTCFVVSFVTGWQQTVLGAEIAIPPKLVDWGDARPMLVASATRAVGDDDVVVQGVQNAGISTVPQASDQETKSISRLPNRKQRRRKPKMASVPVGSQVAAQEIKDITPQAVAQKTDGTDMPIKSQTVVQKTDKADAQVKPQVVAQKTEEADPFASDKPAATELKDEEDPFAPGKQTIKQETKLVQKKAKQYRMAPIRWVANVSDKLDWGRNSSGSFFSSPQKTFTNTQTAGIDAMTYVLHPNIARLKGGVGVVSTSTKTNSSAANSVASNSRDNTLNGDIGLWLFSKSRFPFSLNLGRFDSRSNSSGNIDSTDTITNRLNLTQSYRPLVGTSTYSGSYRRNATTMLHSYNNALSGNSAGSALNGAYSTMIGSRQKQRLYVTALRSTNTSDLEGGSSSDTNMLGARTTFLPENSLLTLSTSANIMTTSQHAQTVSQLGRFLQADALASWQPEEEDIPLSVFANGQFFSNSSSSAGATTTAKSLGGNTNAIYRASPFLNYNAGLATTWVGTNGQSYLMMSENGGVSYQPPAVAFGNKTYRWDTSGSAINSSGGSGQGATRRAITGSIGHGLGGFLSSNLLNNVRFPFSLSQAMSATNSRSDGQTETLSNAGSVGWQGTRGDTTSGTVSLSASDVRTLGGQSPSHTQTIGLNASGDGKYNLYDRYGAKADASVQASRNDKGQTQIDSTVLITYAYSKRGVLGVRHLNYSAAMNMTMQRHRRSNSAAQQQPPDYALQQFLSYRIGSNELLLTSTLSEASGSKSASLHLVFRAWRSVGN